MSDWKADKAFSDKYFPQITTILEDNAKHIMNIAVAPYRDDIHKATDYIIEVKGGTVAARVRREAYGGDVRDWTIRSKRASGAKTELEKLKEGFARWYLYCWTTEGVITSWILVDLDIIREKDILGRHWDEKPNYDRRTWFILIPVIFLKTKGYLAAFHNIDHSEGEACHASTQSTLFLI